MAAVKSPRNHAKMTGFSANNSADRNTESPLGGGLSGQELADLTVLWSRVYGRTLTEDEVLEIYRNVKHLAETLI
ncbi:MAG TPA: hypothetical protein PLE88_07875 [Anaerohalosphaeraceae bacterium]|nr:hypothetical protein [Anaerohalosphaeraceae bacterium]